MKDAPGTPSRRMAIVLAAGAVAASTSVATIARAAHNFPAVGKRYFVDFGKFRVQLYFASETSLTYTGVHSDGSLGSSETVAIKVEELRPNQFLVTWQEADKTVVVHVQDYDALTIVTNITNPNNTFEQYHGKFHQIA